METEDNKCICGEIAQFKCANCRNSSYCSKNHQKLHWKEHKSTCFPIRLGWDKVRGNELLATRDIAQGEVILKEKPATYGPSGKTGIGHSICLSCNTILNQKFIKCSNCYWPVCNETCAKERIHAEFECKIFASNNILPFKNWQQYKYLCVLRCLLLKNYDKTKWTAICKLESHMEEHETNILEAILSQGAVDFILNTCDLGGKFQESEIKFSSSVLSTNAMGDYDISGRYPKSGSYLFLLGCLICHSCTPNVYRAIQPSGELYVRAIVPIKMGQPFLTTYTDLALSTQERQAYLSRFYYFNCTCDRCLDPTELGTFFSAIKCTEPDCGGYLLHVGPSGKISKWACNNTECGVSKNAERVPVLLDSVQEQLEAIVKDQNLEKYMEKLEYYLENHKGKTLHCNHALIYRAEYFIIQTIDYLLSSSIIQEQSTRSKLIERQISLTSNAISLMSNFWRGYSSYRGRLLYYLQNALLRRSLSKVACNLREKKRSRSDQILIENELKEILKLRKEIVEILIFDPPGRDERTIAEKIQKDNPPEIQILIKYCNYYCAIKF